MDRNAAEKAPVFVQKVRVPLLLRAAAELGFSPADAVVIGDKACDIGLGHRVGAMTILIAPADRPERSATFGAHYVAANLIDVAGIVERLALFGASTIDCSA